MKRLLLILGLMLMVYTIFSCEKDEIEVLTPPIEGHILHWNISYMPRRFYPSMNLSDEEKQVVNNLYEGLTRVENDALVLGLADKIETSEDGLLYTVTLKKAQWSDGKLVTTDDFIYSWERKENYKDQMNLLYYDVYINSVEAVDEKTLVITLYQPNENLLKQLSMVAFMPVRRDVIDLNKAIPTFISDVTNGPYYLSSYRLFGDIVLDKNIHYYDFYDVKIDQIKVNLNNNYSSVYQKYLAGAVDFVQSIEHSQLNNLLQNEDAFTVFEKSGIYSFSLNSNHEALKDVRLRRLLNIAIDRTEINPFHNIIKGSEKVSMVQYDDIEYLNEDEEAAGYYMVMKPYVEMDKINAITAALGSGQLELLNGLRVITRNTPNDIRIAKLLVAGWEESLGIKMIVMPKDRYDYAYALKTDDYEVILNNHYFIDGNFRHTLKQFIGQTALNTTEFDSYTYDYNLMSTLTESDDVLYDVFKSVTDELDTSAKMIPLYEIYEPVIISPSVTGWTRSYEKLFYFGRAKKTTKDVEDKNIE